LGGERGGRKVKAGLVVINSEAEIGARMSKRGKGECTGSCGNMEKVPSHDTPGQSQVPSAQSEGFEPRATMCPKKGGGPTEKLSFLTAPFFRGLLVR